MSRYLVIANRLKQIIQNIEDVIIPKLLDENENKNNVVDTLKKLKQAQNEINKLKKSFDVTIQMLLRKLGAVPDEYKKYFKVIETLSPDGTKKYIKRFKIIKYPSLYEMPKIIVRLQLPLLEKNALNIKSQIGNESSVSA